MTVDAHLAAELPISNKLKVLGKDWFYSEASSAEIVAFLLRRATVRLVDISPGARGIQELNRPNDSTN